MRLRFSSHLRAGLRLISLLLCASLGTVLLVRCAPGYFTSADEMDALHAVSAQAQVEAQRQQEGTAVQAWLHFAGALFKGDLGRSHQYDVPVGTLLMPRLRVTGRLLLLGALPAPLLALLCALLCSMVRTPLLQQGVAVATLAGIAVPVSVLASVCLLTAVGGPVAVLLGLLAVRDFRFFVRLLRQQAKAPYLLYARACGIQTSRSMLRAVVQPLWGQLLGVLMLSFVTALSALIPIEVIFGVAGVGSLAWNAAMNRDLPVLLAVTLLMALCIGLAGMAQRSLSQTEPVAV